MAAPQAVCSVETPAAGCSEQERVSQRRHPVGHVLPAVAAVRAAAAVARRVIAREGPRVCCYTLLPSSSRGLPYTRDEASTEAVLLSLHKRENQSGLSQRPRQSYPRFSSHHCCRDDGGVDRATTFAQPGGPLMVSAAAAPATGVVRGDPCVVLDTAVVTGAAPQPQRMEENTRTVTTKEDAPSFSAGLPSAVVRSEVLSQDADEPVDGLYRLASRPGRDEVEGMKRSVATVTAAAAPLVDEASHDVSGVPGDIDHSLLLRGEAAPTAGARVGSGLAPVESAPTCAQAARRARRRTPSGSGSPTVAAPIRRCVSFTQLEKKVEEPEPAGATGAAGPGKSRAHRRPLSALTPPHCRPFEPRASTKGLRSRDGDRAASSSSAASACTSLTPTSSSRQNAVWCRSVGIEGSASGRSGLGLDRRAEEEERPSREETGQAQGRQPHLQTRPSGNVIQAMAREEHDDCGNYQRAWREAVALASQHTFVEGADGRPVTSTKVRAIKLSPVRSAVLVDVRGSCNSSDGADAEMPLHACIRQESRCTEVRRGFCAALDTYMWHLRLPEGAAGEVFSPMTPNRCPTAASGVGEGSLLMASAASILRQSLMTVATLGADNSWTSVPEEGAQAKDEETHDAASPDDTRGPAECAWAGPRGTVTTPCDLDAAELNFVDFVDPSYDASSKEDDPNGTTQLPDAVSHDGTSGGHLSKMDGQPCDSPPRFLPPSRVASPLVGNAPSFAGVAEGAQRHDAVMLQHRLCDAGVSAAVLNEGSGAGDEVSSIALSGGERVTVSLQGTEEDIKNMVEPWRWEDRTAPPTTEIQWLCTAALPSEDREFSTLGRPREEMCALSSTEERLSADGRLADRLPCCSSAHPQRPTTSGVAFRHHQQTCNTDAAHETLLPDASTLDRRDSHVGKGRGMVCPRQESFFGSQVVDRPVAPSPSFRSSDRLTSWMSNGTVTVGHKTSAVLPRSFRGVCKTYGRAPLGRGKDAEAPTALCLSSLTSELYAALPPSSVRIVASPTAATQARRASPIVRTLSPLKQHSCSLPVSFLSELPKVAAASAPTAASAPDEFLPAVAPCLPKLPSTRSRAAAVRRCNTSYGNRAISTSVLTTGYTARTGRDGPCSADIHSPIGTVRLQTELLTPR